jgi:iron complex outermembrane receptor protein
MFNGTPHFGGYLGRKWTGEKQNLFLAMGSYYRLPTLNELYWNPGGNPDLKSERSFGFKMGTKSLTRTAFHLSTDQLYYSQLIQWAPSNSGLWTPQNYAAVYTSTTTGRVHGKYGNNFNELSVTHQFSRVLEVKSQDPAVIGKSLLYRPAFQVVNTFERTLPTGALQCRLYFTSKRHTLRDNALSGVLPSQSWMDVSYVVKSKKDTWAMIFQIENITNAERQFYQYYPMPGRVYSMNIKINSK